LLEIAARDAAGSAETTSRVDASIASSPSAFRDLVMSAADCRTPPRDSVSRADALADAAMVERVLRRGWAGLETMTAAGADFDAVFADLARSIAAAPERIAVAELQDLLVAALRPAADNHLAFFFFTGGGHARRKSVGRHLDAYTAELPIAGGARLLDCAGFATRELMKPMILLAANALTVASRPVVLSETPPPPLRCRVHGENGSTRTVELPLHRLRVGRQGAPSTPAFDLDDGAVPRLTLRTFWTGRESELAAFVKTAPALRERRALVFDLRGNGGGSDSYGKDWLAQLTDQTLIGARVERLDSDVTRQGIVNDNTCQIAEGLTDTDALRGAREHLAYGNRVVDEAESSGAPLRAWRPRSVVTEGRAPSRFRAPLVALVDAGCASACESFVSHVRQLDGAVVVGENTGGIGAFGEVLVYRLPKSGLGMTAGMKYFHDLDPARVVPEGRGHLPDYWIDTDAPAALTQRIADCLAKPACPLRARP
jgi:hypothetical protein